MSRSLYLVAYDVTEPQRLARVCRYFKSYRVAGQKSVPEIWVTASELRTIRADLQYLIDPGTDRIQLIALEQRMTPRCLGQASSFQNPHFCIV